jgi:hypothetical protein
MRSISAARRIFAAADGYALRDAMCIRNPNTTRAAEGGESKPDTMFSGAAIFAPVTTVHA